MKVQQKGNEKEPVRNIELEVKRYVREHMMDNITIPDIAACLHFNPQYLMRAFKAKTGMSILEYMTFARMEQARQLLKTTNLPVKEIACMVGYEDCVYFTKLFRKETGTAPSKYRKLHGRTLGDTMEY